MTKINSLFCEIHINCLHTIRQVPKKGNSEANKDELQKIQKQDRIVSQLKQKLSKAHLAIGLDNKLRASHQLFTLLTTREGKLFVKNNAKFKQSVKNKLIEYIEKYAYTGFIPYYEKILGETYVRSDGGGGYGGIPTHLSFL